MGISEEMRMAQALERIADALDRAVPDTPVYPDTTEYYDENTMPKVHAVLDDVGSIKYTGTDIIDMLQNAGILFRERRKG